MSLRNTGISHGEERNSISIFIQCVFWSKSFRRKFWKTWPESLLETGRNWYQIINLDAILVQKLPAIHNSVLQFNNQPNNETSQFRDVPGKRCPLLRTVVFKGLRYDGREYIFTKLAMIANIQFLILNRCHIGYPSGKLRIHAVENLRLSQYFLKAQIREKNRNYIWMNMSDYCYMHTR